jgi:hypothetical protein
MTEEIKAAVSSWRNEQQEIEPPVAESSLQQPAVSIQVSYFRSRSIFSDNYTLSFSFQLQPTQQSVTAADSAANAVVVGSHVTVV